MRILFFLFCTLLVGNVMAQNLQDSIDYVRKLRAKSLATAGITQNAETYAKACIAQKDYFLFESNYGLPLSFQYPNSHAYYEAKQKLVLPIREKYHFYFKYFGGGCIRNPFLMECTDSFNVIMKGTLSQMNGKDWYGRYEKEEKAILEQNQVFLDSILNEKQVLITTLPYHYNPKEIQLQYANLYQLAHNMLDNPNAFVEIILYPPKNAIQSTMARYQEIVDFEVKNFGIDGSRFRYKAVLNDGKYSDIVRALIKYE